MKILTDFMLWLSINGQLLGSPFPLKNGTHCPLFSHDTTFFKGMCLLIKLRGFWLWRQYWRQFWGYIFSGAYLPQKCCFVWAAPSLLRACTYLIIALNMWVVSWESNLARVKASRRGAKCYPRGEYPVQILKIFVTRSSGLVVTPEIFGGPPVGSSLLCVSKHYLFRSILHLPSIS
jgi:hypothetical protein